MIAVSRPEVNREARVPQSEPGCTRVHDGKCQDISEKLDLWGEQQELIAADGQGGDRLGSAVALSGDTALVSSARGAFVFVRSGAGWSQQGPPLATDISEREQGVALSGDTALIAVPNGVRVFVRKGFAWSEQEPMLSVGGEAAAVAIDRDTALIAMPSFLGGRGAVQVFARNGVSFAPQGPPLFAAGGRSEDYWGESLALSGDTALVGAPGRTINGKKSRGAAFVFVRHGARWTQQGPALAAPMSADTGFGSAVALSGDTALIGLPSQKVGGHESAGVAYVFVRSGSKWTQQGRPLVASDARAETFFGSSLAVSGELALVGSRPAAHSSGAWLIARQGAVWAQQGPMLVADDSTPRDFFAGALAVDGDTLLIGSSCHRVGAYSNEGAAYVYVRAPAGPRAPAHVPRAPILAASDPISSACGSPCVCPDFTPAAAGAGATATLVGRGSFLNAKADEALVELEGCEGHVDDYGGTVIVRQEAEGWRRVAYVPGLVPRDCVSESGPSGISRIACKKMHDSNGGSWFNAAAVVDFLARRESLLITGACEDARDIVSVRFSCNACAKFDATVVLAHGMKRRVTATGSCESISETKRESTLEYLDRGDHYEPTLATTKELLKLPRSKFNIRVKPGTPGPELLPKDWELPLMEL
jgi:hypothetical protein